MKGLFMNCKRTAILATFIFTFLITITSFASGTIDSRTSKLCKMGKVYASGTSSAVYSCMGHSYGKKVDLSKYGLDGELDYVHAMFYLAKVKSDVNAKSADLDKSAVKVKKGTQVVIMYMKRHHKSSSSICRLSNKRTVVIPNSKLTVLKYLYNSSTAYTDAQIEGWVKQNKITSKTKYMFVASKFNQRGWILENINGEWICKYHLGISTGAFTGGGLPNDCYGLNSLQINTHYKNKSNVGPTGRGISYASKEGGNQIHTGAAYHPFTHGCIAMSSKNYNYVYWYLPYKTRVVSY